MFFLSLKESSWICLLYNVRLGFEIQTAFFNQLEAVKKNVFEVRTEVLK